MSSLETLFPLAIGILCAIFAIIGFFIGLFFFKKKFLIATCLSFLTLFFAFRATVFLATQIIFLQTAKIQQETQLERFKNLGLGKYKVYESFKPAYCPLLGDSMVYVFLRIGNDITDILVPKKQWLIKSAIKGDIIEVIEKEVCPGWKEKFVVGNQPPINLI